MDVARNAAGNDEPRRVNRHPCLTRFDIKSARKPGPGNSGKSFNTTTPLLCKQQFGIGRRRMVNVQRRLIILESSADGGREVAGFAHVASRCNP